MATITWTDETGEQHETKSSRWAETLDQPLMIIPKGMEKFALRRITGGEMPEQGSLF